MKSLSARGGSSERLGYRFRNLDCDNAERRHAMSDSPSAPVGLSALLSLDADQLAQIAPPLTAMTRGCRLADLFGRNAKPKRAAAKNEAGDTIH
jgi:hypothetical protein